MNVLVRSGSVYRGDGNEGFRRLGLENDGSYCPRNPQDPYTDNFSPPSSDYVPPSPIITEGGSVPGTPEKPEPSPTQTFFDKKRSNNTTPIQRTNSMSSKASSSYEGRSVCCNCNWDTCKLITSIFFMVVGVLFAGYGIWQSYLHNSEDPDGTYNIRAERNICLVAGAAVTVLSGIFCLCCVPIGTCSSCCCCSRCCPNQDEEQEI